MPRKKYCGACDTNVVPADDGDCQDCGGGLDTLPREEPDGEAFRGREAAGYQAEQQARIQREWK